MNIRQIASNNTQCFGARLSTKTRKYIANEVIALRKAGKTEEARELDKTAVETSKRIKEYGDSNTSLSIYTKDFGSKIGFAVKSQFFEHPLVKPKFLTPGVSDLKTALESITEEQIDKREGELITKYAKFTRTEPFKTLAYNMPSASRQHWLNVIGRLEDEADV